MSTGFNPDLVALQRRAVTAFHAGRAQEAVTLFEKLAQGTNDAGACSNLAMVLASLGRFDESVQASAKAVSVARNVPELHANLGNALQVAGRIDEAIEEYRHALILRPNYPDAQSNLAQALTTAGSFDEAIGLLGGILSVQPDSFAPLINLAIALQGKGDLDGAIAACHRALTVQPKSAEAHSNLALALKDAGQLDEAIEHFRQSLKLQPNRHVADALLVLLHYHPSISQESLLREHRDWFAQYIENQIHELPPAEFDDSPTRRLRIGYVSPDFREHPVGYNILPLLEHHNHNRFDVYCYSDVTRPDALTQRMRACANQWRNIRSLNDEHAADLIREDRIDILVDLALHTGQNRLAVFARKPAPIQVSFAGYPGTTGLPAIHYRLTDPFLDPPQPTGDRSVDTPIRLPNSFWCYQPLGTEPDVGPLPAFNNGFVTFGCLNNFCKVNRPVLQLWARVLVAVKGSRLLLLSKEGSHRDQTRSVLQALGVDRQRVEFVGPKDRDGYLKVFGGIDISLDTFPYNGHTTSLDSMWMGVPVVTLVGATPVGRAGWSQLQNLGLADLAADDPAAYVRIATTLAVDLPALADLRTTLRGRMQTSPLTDARSFAQGIESAFEGIWRNSCMLQGQDRATGLTS
ncbi:MAG TPA: tetratricopeptide repeat protein [Tepidisphaeraceae bacterium]|jgi:predicted O-linked N-acetylglucosamine transferase (SPINDLY family)